MTIPLCVDLDGSLIRSDSLLESILLLTRRHPWMIFCILYWWIIQGRAACKDQISKRVQLEGILLPYHTELLEWLKTEKAQGRVLILVTAAHINIAQEVEKQLNIFSEIIASTPLLNLKGQQKRLALTEKYGEKQFDYIGNAWSDLTVWKSARQAILVNPSKRLLKAAKNNQNVVKVFREPRSLFKLTLKSLRVHQYVKNLLIFLPLLLNHPAHALPIFGVCLLAFLGFSALASHVYIINDLLDLQADRHHRSKKYRPFASGALSVTFGVGLAILCFSIAMLIGWLLPESFRWVLLIYYGVTLAYSFGLKQLLLVDVLVLSALYTLRILAGMSLLTAGYSSWLLLFSLFFFTSLAFLKRYTELDNLEKKSGQILKGRAYLGEHTEMIKNFGINSGYLSVLIFALYLNSYKASIQYIHPEFLYLVCPVILYWVSRLWLKAAEGKVHDDPIVFAIKDRLTYGLFFVIVVIGFLASI